MLGANLRRLVFPWSDRKKRAAESQLTRIPAKKFARSPPSLQSTVDIFQGHWATDLSDILPGVQSGPTKLFEDPRTAFPLVRFASLSGDLGGQRVLELGPLEGAHTYQLEKLGADVVAVEANTEAYLKCLLVKELSGLRRARFLYGDCVEYLRESTERFDMVFCCGVLYHMADPVKLIELMAARTDRVFVWTHYHVPGNKASNGRRDLVPAVVERGGKQYTYYQRNNVDRASPTFWGGTALSACLMTRDGLMQAFKCQGLVQSVIHEDERDHPGGPALSLSVWRD